MNFKNVLFLLSGVGLGAVSTYFFMKDKCEQMIAEETEAVKSYYEDKYIKNIEEKETTNTESDELEKKENIHTETEPDYDDIIEKLNYNQFSTKTNETQKEKKPYIISMDDYNTDTNYEKVIISYFEDDGVLMFNDTKEILDNVGKDIGNDNIERLNEDGNEIYVRNEVLGVDYNIVSEPGSYEDFIDE